VDRFSIKPSRINDEFSHELRSWSYENVLAVACELAVSSVQLGPLVFGRFRLFCRLGAPLRVSAAILGVMVAGGDSAPSLEHGASRVDLSLANGAHGFDVDNHAVICLKLSDDGQCQCHFSG
jgi:hypothetical protein